MCVFLCVCFWWFNMVTIWRPHNWFVCTWVCVCHGSVWWQSVGQITCMCIWMYICDGSIWWYSWVHSTGVCVYLGWFNMVTIRWPQHWFVCVYVCMFVMVQYGNNLEDTVLVCLLVCVWMWWFIMVSLCLGVCLCACVCHMIMTGNAISNFWGELWYQVMIQCFAWYMFHRTMKYWLFDILYYLWMFFFISYIWIIYLCMIYS